MKDEKMDSPPSFGQAEMKGDFEMDELERCPFCGGEPHWFHDIDGLSIECIDCSFSIGVTFNFDDGKPTIDEDEKKLAEIWNSVDRTKTPKKEEKEDDDDYI